MDQHQQHMDFWERERQYEQRQRELERGRERHGREQQLQRLREQRELLSHTDEAEALERAAAENLRLVKVSPDFATVDTYATVAQAQATLAISHRLAALHEQVANVGTALADSQKERNPPGP